MTRAEYKAATNQYRAAQRIVRIQLDGLVYADRDQFGLERNRILANPPVPPYTLPADKLFREQAQRRSSVTKRLAHIKHYRSKGMVDRHAQRMLRLTLVSVPVTPAPLPRWNAQPLRLAA